MVVMSAVARRPVIAVAVLEGRHQAEHGPGRDLVVFPPADLGQPAGRGRGTSNVAGPTSTSTSRSPSQTSSPRAANQWLTTIGTSGPVPRSGRITASKRMANPVSSFTHPSRFGENVH